MSREPTSIVPLRPAASPQLESQLFRQFFDISPDGIVLLDNRDRVLKANPAFLRMFGYQFEEVRGNTISELIVDEAFRPEARRISRRALENQLAPQEALRCRKDGELLHVEIFGMPVEINDHQIGIYAVYRDITARRQAEDLLAQSEEKYRSIVETLEDGYFETDLAGNLLFFNAALARILGRDVGELPGMNNRDYMN
jgi:PAS domain S-box-containing protein